MNLAEKLTIQRKKSGMSQEQLAERLGITRQSVSKWEAGSSIPEISKLVAMSEIFRVSLDYLLKDYLDEEKNSGIAAGGCRNEPYGEKRSEANQQMDEDNSRLEKKVDDLARYIKGYQYTSKTKIAGIPLVSIRFSRQLGRDGIAKGIIAIGNVAIGVISLGACSFGIISFGSIAVGLLAIGALAFGLAAWGAVAIGVVAFGASAMGIYSAGASAWGQETVKGTHCLTIEQGVTTGAQIEHFLEDTNPNLWKPLRDMLTAFAAHL